MNRCSLAYLCDEQVFVASDDATVPHKLRLLLAARGVPQTDLRLVTVGEGLGDLGDRRQTSSDFKEHGVPAAKWIEHRLQQGELPKKQIALQVCLNPAPTPPPHPPPPHPTYASFPHVFG